MWLLESFQKQSKWTDVATCVNWYEEFYRKKPCVCSEKVQNKDKEIDEDNSNKMRDKKTTREFLIKGGVSSRS